MLTFERGLQSGYKLDLTVLPLRYAVILMGIGCAISLAPKFPFALLGGVVDSLGIAACFRSS